MKKYLNKFPIFLIKIYQLTLSPDHGFLNIFFIRSRCRFYPSCSDYALESVRQYGLLKGVMVSCSRIIRCNPWSGGGYDPITVKE
ncbi:MAG: membrane protein insertion efficiency factor YidD [Patescibacteria group bacterium]